jgi:hypothetical protein
VKPNQIYVIALAVLCNLKQIEYSEETGFPRQFRSDIRKPDRCDRLDFYLAVSHAIAAAFHDMGPSPNPDATSNVAANHPFAKTLGKNHGLLWTIAAFDYSCLFLPKGWSSRRPAI